MHKKTFLFYFLLLVYIAHITYLAQETNDIFAFNASVHAPRSIAHIPDNIHTLSEFFDSGLNVNCALTNDQILTYIAAGKNRIAHLDQTLSTKQHLNEIVGIAWYVYSLAIAKSQAHTHGIFVIEDRQQHLYNFLRTYITKVNHSQTQPLFLSTTNKYGYPRFSSHFARHQHIHPQYGIDIRFEDQSALPLLPTGKRHILFGQLDDQYMFIKMEDSGLYYADGFISHSVGMLMDIGRKKIPTLFGSIDHTLQRTENIPHAIKQQYAAIAKKHGLSPQLHAIKDIFALSIEEQTHFKELIKEISSTYDHPRLRYGREVLLLENEWLSATHHATQ
jgi:hypothetical protein